MADRILVRIVAGNIIDVDLYVINTNQIKFIVDEKSPKADSTLGQMLNSKTINRDQLPNNIYCDVVGNRKIYSNSLVNIYKSFIRSKDMALYKKIKEYIECKKWFENLKEMHNNKTKCLAISNSKKSGKYLISKRVKGKPIYQRFETNNSLAIHKDFGFSENNPLDAQAISYVDAALTVLIDGLSNSNTRLKEYFEFSNKHCVICRKKFDQENPHDGHIFAKEQGGSNDSENICYICGSCNSTESMVHMCYFQYDKLSRAVVLQKTNDALSRLGEQVIKLIYDSIVIIKKEQLYAPPIKTLISILSSIHKVRPENKSESDRESIVQAQISNLLKQQEIDQVYVKKIQSENYVLANKNRELMITNLYQNQNLIAQKEVIESYKKESSHDFQSISYKRAILSENEQLKKKIVELGKRDQILSERDDTQQLEITRLNGTVLHLNDIIIRQKSYLDKNEQEIAALKIQRNVNKLKNKSCLGILKSWLCGN